MGEVIKFPEREGKPSGTRVLDELLLHLRNIFAHNDSYEAQSGVSNEKIVERTESVDAIAQKIINAFSDIQFAQPCRPEAEIRALVEEMLMTPFTNEAHASRSYYGIDARVNEIMAAYREVKNSYQQNQLEQL